MRNNEERISTKQFKQDPTPHQQVISNNQLNFIAPTEYVDLPSKGKFYSANHPLFEKTSIEIKQMTAKEEDILTNRTFLKKGVALDRLLESIIIDKSIDHKDLLIADRNAIFVAARISGYGPDYVTSVICPSCEKKNKYSFNLIEKLEAFEEDEDQTEIDEYGHFTITLPSTKWSVKCRALTGLDERKLISSAFSKTNEEFTLLDQLRMLIVSIEDVTDPNLINQAISVMPALDSKYLRKNYELVIPSLNLKNNFTCQDCDFEEVLEVPLTADFFWPK